MAPPERLTIGDLLRLVEQLSPAEHQEFVEEMKLLWLREELQKGENDLENGRSLSADELLKSSKTAIEQSKKKEFAAI